MTKLLLILSIILASLSGASAQVYETYEDRVVKVAALVLVKKDQEASCLLTRIKGCWEEFDAIIDQIKKTPAQEKNLTTFCDLVDQAGALAKKYAK